MIAALVRRPRTQWPAVLACVLALAVVSRSARAADSALCAPPAVPPPPDAALEAPALEADSASLGEDGISVVEGNVVLRTRERIITAGRLEYDADRRRAEADGGVTVRESDAFLEGDRLVVDLESGEAELHDAKANILSSHARI